MKERIRKIMEVENMTPARFADSLEIGRAVISHILNGRNNPSLDIITRVLTKMPNLNSEWLLTGTGSMYKGEKKEVKEEAKTSDNMFLDLFNQIPPETPINTYKDTEEKEYRQENIVVNAKNEDQSAINEKIVYKEMPSKKIKQIIIYYSDNTFETFQG